MNKERRVALEQLAGQIEATKESLLEYRADEQEYYDNMPESLRNGSKGDAAQQAVDNLDEAIDSLEHAVSSIEEARSA